MPRFEPIDPVLAALDKLETVMRETADRNRTALRRADAIRRSRKRGIPYREIVPKEERPLVVELLTRTLVELSDAGSNFRRVEARALYSEGLTMSEIAKLFGVTRQRIAALLTSGSDLDGQMRGSNRLAGVAGALAFVSPGSLDFSLLLALL